MAPVGRALAAQREFGNVLATLVQGGLGAEQNQ